MARKTVRLRRFYHPRPLRRSYIKALPILLAALGAPRLSLAVTTDNWTLAGSGNWSIAANWTNASSLHTVPAAGDTVNIVNNDGISRTITLDVATPSLAAFTLDLTGGAGTNTLSMTGGSSLSASSEIIGNSGNAAFFQINPNSVTGSLTIGNNSTSNGFYNLNGATLTVGGSQVVGNAGIGTLSSDGGTDNITGNLSIGLTALGNGNVSITNFSSISAANVFVGGSNTTAGGKGLLTIGPSSTLNTTNLTVYNTAGSSINLNGGTINAGNLFLSGNPALFNWTAGTLHLATQLDFTNASDPYGNVHPFGNSLTINQNQTLTNDTWEWLLGTGSSITQNGGTNNANVLYVGNTFGAGAPATYTLNAGTLNAPSGELLGYLGSGSGGSALFTQAGGIHTPVLLLIGYNAPATFNQSAGATVVNNYICLGYVAASGNGTLNLSGGTMTAPALYIGGNTTNAVGKGAVTVSGAGALNISGNITVYNTAGNVLNLNGGSLTAANLLLPNSSFFHWTAGALHLTSQFVDISPTGLFGNSLTITSAQSLTTNNNQWVDGAGSSVTQTGGANNAFILLVGTNFGGAAASYSISGGNLNVGPLEVGYIGPGDFSQSGGAVVSTELDVGMAGTATFSLSGNSSFNTSAELFAVSSNATASQTGGLNAVNGIVSIANAPGYSASYTLSGGTFRSTGNFTVGGTSLSRGGTGVLTVSGSGNLTTNSTLTVYNSPGNALNLNGGTINAAALNFDANPSLLNWTTGTLRITSSVTFDPSSTPTSTSAAFGTGRTLASGQTLIVDANEGLGGTGPFNFTLNPGSTHTVTGSLTLGATGTLTLNGGTLNVGGLSFPGTANNFTWNTGTLNINADVAWDSSAPSSTTGAAFGSSLSLNANQTLLISGNETIGGAGPFTLSLNAGASHAVTGNITLNANGTLINNTNTVITYNTFIQNGGTVSGQANNTVYNTNNYIYNGGLINGQFRNLGTATINATFFQPANGIDNEGFLNIGNSAAYVSSGSLFNTGTIQLAGGLLNYTTGSPLLLYGTITGFGSVGCSAALTIENQVIQGAGRLTFSATAFTNLGDIDMAPTQTLWIPIFGNVTNSGLINLNGGILDLYGMTNSPAGVISGNGSIYGNNNFINAGLLELDAGLLTIFGSASTNTGTILLNGNTALLNAPFNSSGTIQGFGRVNSNITNTGTIESVGGTLSFTGPLTSTGTLRAATGTKLLLQNFPTNAGLIDLAGGTLDTNSQPLNNTGQIAGFGVLATGGLTNNGSIVFTDGPATINGNVTNAPGKTILAKNFPALFTGNVTNNGTIKITNTTVTFTGNYSGNAYISDPATNIFQANATVIPGGLMTGGPGDQFLFNTFTNNGTFSNGGNLTVSTAITNTGNFTQSGPQLWLPTATFTNAAGNATFASNAKLYGLTITSGTVDITSSKFIIQTAPATKAATLAALQQNIVTHALTAGSNPANYALALIDNALLNKPSFGGNPADSNSLLLAPELLGDTNIDGTVNLLDLQTVLNNFGKSSPNWTDGNFDHTSTINLTDLADVLNNFGLINPNPSASPFTDAAPPAPTPEPASLLLLLPLLATALPKRRLPKRPD